MIHRDLPFFNSAASCRVLGALAIPVISAVLLASGSVARAQTFTGISILGTTNLYGAGRSGAAQTPAPGGSGGGTSPASTTFILNNGTSRVLTFSSVTGLVTYNGGGNNTTPDGSQNTNTLNTSGFQGISGITFTNRAGFLTGVFINGAPPTADGTVGSPPATLAYPALSPDALSYSPLLNQAFFIGDGRTGTDNASGTIQQFLVPSGATQLVLGFEDAPNYAGTPGAYSDNSGSYTASFSISGTAAPEPAALVLLAVGLVGMGGTAVARRCKR